MATGTRTHWLVTIGLVGLIVAAVDPLEGSIVSSSRLPLSPGAPTAAAPVTVGSPPGASAWWLSASR